MGNGCSREFNWCGDSRWYMEGDGMSVINKMLQDLDEQQKSKKDSNEQLSYPKIDVTVQPNKLPKSLMLAVVLVLSTIVASATLWWWQNQADEAVTQPIASEVVIKKPVEQKQPQAESTIRKTEEPVVAAKPADKPEQKKAPTIAFNANVKAIEENKLASTNQPVDDTDQNTQAESLTTPVTTENVPVESINKTVETVLADEAQEPKVASFNKTPSSKTPEQMAEKAFKRGSDAYLRGRFALAESEFKKALAFQPDLHEARAQWVGLLFGEQNYQKAMTLLQYGITLYPEHTGYRMLAARIWLELEQPQTALQVLQDHSPNERFNDFYQLKAALSQQNQKWQLALDSWQALLKANPNQQRGTWLLGAAIAYEQLNKSIDALDYYRLALKMGLPINSAQYARSQIANLEQNND
ncbi:hypothetical protein HR060_03185 [Catenovulum sp. SM1970]|uniref:tetratricopeptide repeat protein n=1 Tax=Marinifaba aquimaris TaxID=2741323 RepID=UPI001572AAA3|nr:tetratricopeptide repeat protein [Marinifaba aquimaris]NTS75861.1 hypothetical protein [Marinifaba aquimaris]